MEDHYSVLGLVSGEEGSKLTEQEISSAYRKKARESHPDKNPNDPDAPAKFQKLRLSYEILKDPKSRKEFDDLLRVRREKKKIRYNRQFDAKRRRMMSDLEERERAWFVDLEKKERDEEEEIKRKLDAEIARVVKAMFARKPVFPKENVGGGGGGGGGGALDRSKVLKVSWEKGFSEYSASKLKELFEQFGVVEDVVINSSKNQGSAIVEMRSKEDAVAATRVVIGDLSNPLLVLPLQPFNPTPSNVVGAGFQAFEASILDKLRKAAEKQKLQKKT
ncbi:hypothetical protein SOVF_116010 [Spinacia oleracea]|nr:hypothetical protein SOVF_116010 [Spinacia oleracea]